MRLIVARAGLVTAFLLLYYLFDDGEHVFGPIKSSKYITTEEKAALVTIFNLSEVQPVIDPILISEKLHEKGILNIEFLNNTRRMKAHGQINAVILNYLLFILPAKTDMRLIVQLLIECNYEEIATRVYCSYLTINGRINKAIKGHSEPRNGLRKASKRIKSDIHNAPFANRGEHLRAMEKRFVLWLPNAKGTRSRQCLADMCFTIKGAEIDAMAITFNMELCKNDIFRRYEAIIPETSNPTLSEIGLLGRHANACAIAGKFAEAEEKLVHARGLSISVGPSLELFNLIYTEIYVRLWHYERNPTEPLRHSIVFWGKTGLKVIEDETDSYTRNAWKQNFMLRMSLCLLGLGNTTNLIKGCNVDKKCMEEAMSFRRSLSSQEIMESIQLRRLMLFYIVTARLLELCDCPNNSLTYYHYARQKAESGNFEELKYIHDHIQRVLNKFTTDIGNLPSYCAINALPIQEKPTSDKNDIHFQLLKEISLDERGEPSGCSQPDDTFNISRKYICSAPGITYQLSNEEHDKNMTRSTEIKAIYSENILPLNLQCDQQSAFVLETRSKSTERVIVNKLPTECAYRLHSSGDQFAMNFESTNNFSECSSTEYKGLYYTYDTEHKSSDFDNSLTEVKHIKSIETGRSIDHASTTQGLEDLNIELTDMNEEGEDVYGKGIPSWERQPPSGQSSD